MFSAFCFFLLLIYLLRAHHLIILFPAHLIDCSIHDNILHVLSVHSS